MLVVARPQSGSQQGFSLSAELQSRMSEVSFSALEEGAGPSKASCLNIRRLGVPSWLLWLFIVLL
jgi:hypothetical protein